MGRKTKEQIRKDKATAYARKSRDKNFVQLALAFSKTKPDDVTAYSEIKAHTARKDYIVSLVLKDIEERSKQG